MRIISKYILLLLLICNSYSQNRISKSANEIYIRDDAKVLNVGEIDSIQTLLAQHNANSIGRITIRIISNVPKCKTISSYSRELINYSSANKTNKVDRILLLIAISDRQLRIETSKDVRDIVSDNYCKMIIDDVITPEFKKGKYYSGIKYGIDSLIRKLSDTTM